MFVNIIIILLINIKIWKCLSKLFFIKDGKKEMKKFFKEFKEFAMKGNVVDLAVGVIIGGAFQAIINSVVNDLIMPLIGLLTGGVNFNEQFLILKLPEGVTAESVTSAAVASELGVTTLNYGALITAILNFVIMAFVIFLMVKFINKLTSLGKKEVVEVKTTRECPYCKSVVSIKAVRCPHCTSELELEEE